ncbi:MAG TPA: hypothetical protein VGO03_18010 [Acidimicrobiia bacterium]
MSLQYVAASALALVLLVMAANLLVDLYVRAAVRDALDEGVRAAVPLGGTAADCTARADDTIQGLVRGDLGHGVALRCAITGGVVTADADVVLPAFVAGLPGWSFRLRAEAEQEGPP